MLPDAEIDSLAEELFELVLAEARKESTRYFYDVNERRAVLYGEPGLFRFGVVALPIIKRIIRSADRLLDRYSVTKNRDEALRTIATAVTMHFVWSLGWRAQQSIAQAVEDCLVFAEAIVWGSPDVNNRDVRPLVTAAVEKWSKARRKFLLDYIEQLPNLQASGPGRPVVTSFARAVERREYVAAIESVYRRLKEELGRKPKKVEMAEALGAGGINPRTGSDTRLNTFNNKLRRLGIDYSALIERIETTP